MTCSAKSDSVICICTHRSPCKAQSLSNELGGELRGSLIMHPLVAGSRLRERWSVVGVKLKRFS